MGVEAMGARMQQTPRRRSLAEQIRVHTDEFSDDDLTDMPTDVLESTLTALKQQFAANSSVKQNGMMHCEYFDALRKVGGLPYDDSEGTEHAGAFGPALREQSE
jgi:hypothetical protein